MKPLAPIRSAEELKKLLYIQQNVVHAAKVELVALTLDSIEPEKFIINATRLLEKYATYPTLSEFAADPKLANEYKWGATFGVVTLVSGLILEEIKTLQPHFASVLRQALFLVLKELHQPEHQYLIDPLLEAITVQVKVGTPERRKQIIVCLLKELADTIVQVVALFGLAVTDGTSAGLTITGERVVKHMVDAHHFAGEMTKAHAKFQTIKPNITVA